MVKFTIMFFLTFTHEISQLRSSTCQTNTLPSKNTSWPTTCGPRFHLNCLDYSVCISLRAMLKDNYISWFFFRFRRTWSRTWVSRSHYSALGEWTHQNIAGFWCQYARHVYSSQRCQKVKFSSYAWDCIVFCLIQNDDIWCLICWNVLPSPVSDQIFVSVFVFRIFLIGGSISTFTFFSAL